MYRPLFDDYLVYLLLFFFSTFTLPNKANQNQLAKNQAKENSVDKIKAKEHEEKKAEILAKLKTQGRQKWSGLINVIMGILTPHADMLEFKNKGSHFKIHIKGQKESAGLTLITPHGHKCGEVPAGVARNLASELFDLIKRLSEKT